MRRGGAARHQSFLAPELARRDVVIREQVVPDIIALHVAPSMTSSDVPTVGVTCRPAGIRSGSGERENSSNATIDPQ